MWIPQLFPQISRIGKSLSVNKNGIACPCHSSPVGAVLVDVAVPLALSELSAPTREALGAKTVMYNASFDISFLDSLLVEARIARS